MAGTQAIPGTVVPVGAQIGPAGAYGAQGPTGPTGLTGPAGPAAVSTDAGNIAVIGSDGLISVPQSTLWATRLRSFNAIGNPTFEVDQRNIHGVLTNPANTTFLCDRWQIIRTGGITGTVNTNTATAASPLLIPGTNFGITMNWLSIVLGTTQSSIAASDYILVRQLVEGPQWRELSSDVHSLSLLANSTVAGLSFTAYIKDPATTTKSIVYLCTIPSANTWTLITLPNIPVFPSGNFVATPGANAYEIGICFACGSTGIAAATGTWQSGNYQGASGMSNFLNQSSGSQLRIGVVQHEPGPLCTTLIDKPFTQNLDECLRYYEKSYSYNTAVGTATAIGCVNFMATASQNALIPVRYKKIMAKGPALTAYNPNTGAVNSVYNYTGSASLATTSAYNGGDAGFDGFAVSSPPASVYNVGFHYTADTGW